MPHGAIIFALNVFWSIGAFTFPPADNEREDKCQDIVQIDIQFIIAVGGFEHLYEKKVVEYDSDGRPSDSYGCIVLYGIAFYFFEQHPERHKHPDRHNHPANHAGRNGKEENKAQHIADQP